MNNQNRSLHSMMPEFTKVFLKETALNLLERETIQSGIRGVMRKLATGSREKPYHPVDAVEKVAEQIMTHVRQKNITLQRIAIDGPPGSGKSTLGRSLAQKTGLTWQTLFARQLTRPITFQQNHIYENIRLIRSQDMECFDLIIYVDVPVEISKKRVLQRDRNGTLVDVFDFDLIKNIGDTAFDMLQGREIRIKDTPHRLKFRPRDGYRDVEKLRQSLILKEIPPHDYSKEELLFMYCCGILRKGITPYLKIGAYNQDILNGLSAAVQKVFYDNN